MTGDGPEPIDVLVVDDEADLAELAAERLEREHAAMAVDVAHVATEGLAALEAGNYDCVVSDYDMPETDGLAFPESVRESAPELPFILFTGAGSRSTRRAEARTSPDRPGVAGAFEILFSRSGVASGGAALAQTGRALD